jgi:hypothetical protein
LKATAVPPADSFHSRYTSHDRAYFYVSSDAPFPNSKRKGALELLASLPFPPQLPLVLPRPDPAGPDTCRDKDMRRLLSLSLFLLRSWRAGAFSVPLSSMARPALPGTFTNDDWVKMFR